jgi:hypothetical protein
MATRQHDDERPRPPSTTEASCEVKDADHGEEVLPSPAATSAGQSRTRPRKSSTPAAQGPRRHLGQIAAKTGISKTSLHRCLAAGPADQVTS